MSEKGTGILPVTVDVLEGMTFLAFMPRSFRVIGSEKSEIHGVVMLVVESEEIVGHGDFLTFEIEDVGSTRTVRIVQHPEFSHRELSGS